MSQFSFCRTANTETAEYVFVWSSSFLTQTPSRIRNSRWRKNTWKHAQRRGRWRSRSVSRGGCGMHVRFSRYSKSETAKCRPVEDLSALNQTSGQDRRREVEAAARPNPCRTTAQRHTILLLKAPGTIKTRVFHFLTNRYTQYRGREREIYANNPSPLFSSTIESSKLGEPEY